MRSVITNPWANKITANNSFWTITCPLDFLKRSGFFAAWIGYLNVSCIWYFSHTLVVVVLRNNQSTRNPFIETTLRYTAVLSVLTMHSLKFTFKTVLRQSLVQLSIESRTMRTVSHVAYLGILISRVWCLKKSRYKFWESPWLPTNCVTWLRKGVRLSSEGQVYCSLQPCNTLCLWYVVYEGRRYV